MKLTIQIDDVNYTELLNALKISYEDQRLIAEGLNLNDSYARRILRARRALDLDNYPGQSCYDFPKHETQ